MYKILATILLLVALSASAPAQGRFPWVTADRSVYDFGEVLTEDGAKRLAALTEQARTAFSVPFFAVLIPSTAEYGGQGLQADAYAEQLLATFQAQAAVASPESAPKTVVLLLVEENQQVRIALGKGWGSEHFLRSRGIIQDMREDFLAGGAYTEGILEGAQRLLDLAQEAANPESDLTTVYIAASVAALLLIAGLAVLVWRRRRTARGALPEAVLQQHRSLIIRRLKKGADPDAFDEQGYTAAIYAAGQGDIEVLRQLLGYGANLGLGTSQGETPLYAAAQHGQLQAVIYLLKHGAPVDPETVHRETPLLIAAREGHVDIVRVLLDVGANVNQQDNRGWSALMIALRENHTDLMNLLLGHNVDVNLAPKDGAHALMMAVKQEDEDLVRRLLERGADVHHMDRDGMCSLRIAVLRGNQAIVRRLLNAGADVTAPFANKETPVEVAEREGHKELAEYLRKRVKRLAACMDILEVVARGDLERIKEIVIQVPRSVNVHSARSRWTPLLIAVRAQQLEIAETLLQYGADVHTRSKEGKAAIAYAVDTDNLAMVKILLEGGARIDQIDGAGTDLRGYAQQNGRDEIVNFIDSFVAQQAAGYAVFQAVRDDDPPKALAILKERPLCVDARTRHERWTPLLHAARANNLAMIKLLLEFDPQVNLTNNRGMSALMYAARNGNLEVVRMLINRGADVRLRSREGNTACDFALDRGHARVVMLLQEVEAQLSDLSRAGFFGPPEAQQETISDLNPVDGASTQPKDNERGRSDDIFRAIQENDLNFARKVLEYWPECVSLRRGPSELTPLHTAINAGLYTMAEILVEAGADVNALTRECKTPLYQAVARADVNLVALLLKHGAHVWQIVQGQTAVQVAQAAGYEDIVEELTRTPVEQLD